MFQRPAVTQRISYVLRKDENRNAHLLGVNALALDTLTPTASLHPSAKQHPHPHHCRHSSSKHYVPGGILYTGGRDGMIASWDLHLESPLPRDIPGESPDQPKGLPPSTFRQSFNHHTDWVNDIVLCHNGETLVSASSDRTVKLVRPHSHNPSAAHIIGTHGDYVKTLAYAAGPGWLASGGLDKTVNIWDIKEGRSGQFASLGAIPETSSKASIYALACNPAGTVLATGSPEKACILSASSDTTIKLWSLTAQRCITTFTMHSDSVWSLYSDHPQLTTFYGGGKDGLVTKTEVNRHNPQHHNGYEDEDPGQCVVICKAETGIARLVAHDDARIWTATSSSSVYQWPDIPTRANRSHELIESIVPANLLKMNLDDSAFTDPIPEHYYPTSTVYSAASLGSLYISNRDKQSQHSSEDDEGLVIPIFEGPENVIEGEHGLVKHTVLNNRRMVVTEDKCGEVALWDIIKCVQLDTFSGRKLEDVVNELNTVESVPTWCTIDTRIGALTVHLDEARCFDAEVYVDEIEETPDPDRPEDQRIIIGKWVLKNLFDNYVPVHIDAYEKEAYRIQHQDGLPAQIMVPTTIVTNERNEVVDGTSVTLETRAVGTQENGSATTDAASIGGKPPTINTTPEGLREPSTMSEPPASSNEGSNANSASATPQEDQSAMSATSAPHSDTLPKQASNASSSSAATAGTGGKLNAPVSLATSPSIPSTPVSTFSATSAASSSSNGFMGRLKHSVKKLARTPSAEQRFENGRPASSRKGLLTSGGSITIPSGGTVFKIPNSPSIPEHAPSLPAVASSVSMAGSTGTTTSSGSSPRTTTVEEAASLAVTSTAASAAGGFLPRRGSSTNLEDEQSTSDTTSSYSIDFTPSPMMQLPDSTISVRPPHPPFTPPTHLDCPMVAIPAHIPVVISEQSREASSSVDLYRGSVGSLAQDYVPLVQVIPTWLLEVLLKNMIPVKEMAKVSFVLRPHHDQEAIAAPAGLGRLGELPGGNPRLTAPRMLRIRKVVAHVVEKLSLTPPSRRLGSSVEISQSEIGTGSAMQHEGAQFANQTTMPLKSVKEGSYDTSDQPPSLPRRTSSATATENFRAAEPPIVQMDNSQEPENDTGPPSKINEEEEEEEYMRQAILRPENWLEILCNDQPLSPTMTLATIRTHYWKTGSDVVLTYRYKDQGYPDIATASSISA
ncbi:hypothetical protein EDD11_006535 [Mortierella claussenii]|nr:hypothetical protein EDD11_006535 [Mortierella claussenii]